MKLSEVVYLLNHKHKPLDISLSDFPSIRFALETALFDLENGGKRNLFSGDFSMGNATIRTNGLVWMDDLEGMWNQCRKKIESGFTCIKFKVGNHNLKNELALLDKVRSTYGEAVEIRLDANGAFDPDQALETLQAYSAFNIHSIEQPIQPNQPEALERICQDSPIDIALDEELIGHRPETLKSLLRETRPHYLVLKPGLLGGFQIL